MDSPATETPARRLTDISPYLAVEVVELLSAAAIAARQRRLAEVNSLLTLKVLADQGKIKTTLSFLKFEEKRISEIEDRLKSAGPKSFSAVAIHPHLPSAGVVFAPRLHQALLLGFLYANRANLGSRHFSPVTLNDFTLGLLLSADLSLNGWDLNLDRSFLGKMTYLLEMAQPGSGGEISDLDEAGLTKDLAAELSHKQIFGRLEEVQEVLRVLVRQKKNNVFLVGEPGVGKKAIVLALLNRLQEPGSLNPLKDFSFLDFNLQSLSTLENRENLGKLLEIELAQKSPVILYLENIEVLRDKDQVGLFINFLYNLGLKATVRFIVAVTPSFYNQFLQTDPLSLENFEVIKVLEMSESQMESVLRSVAQNVGRFHQVEIDPTIFKDLIGLCRRYLKGLALPEEAVSLLEEAASDAAVSGKHTVAAEDILKIISQKSGVPIATMTVSEKDRLLHLEDELSRQVIGQAEAVKKVAEAVRRARAGLKDPKKPIGSFLFLGPTGVGKTELAKALARIVFDSEKAFVRLDMSEYAEAHTAQRLIGAPPGYVGYEEGGQLTNPVLAHPYSLILLDEIEKAHPRVFDIFLQVLDDGRLTDSQGRLVDFKNTIIIATSNIAQEEVLAQGQVVPSERKQFFEDKILPKLKESFRPEFINRFEEIVIFNSLSRDELGQIARLKLGDVEKRLESQKINLKVRPETIVQLVEDSYDPRFGARPLVRKIREEIENKIAQKIIESNLKEGDTLEL